MGGMVTIVLVCGFIILVAMMVYLFISAIKSPPDHRDLGGGNLSDDSGSWSGDSHHFNDHGGSDGGSHSG